MSYSLFGETSEKRSRGAAEREEGEWSSRSTRENRRGSSPAENQTLKSSRTCTTVNIYSRRKNYKLATEVNDYPLRVTVAELRFLPTDIRRLQVIHYLSSIFVELLVIKIGSVQKSVRIASESLY